MRRVVSSGQWHTKSVPLDGVLSARQAQVIALVAEGLSDKEIALGLGLSTSTVKTYLGRLYRAHGLKNRAQAVGLYARLQFLASTSITKLTVDTSVDFNGVGRLDDGRISDL